MEETSRISDRISHVVAKGALRRPTLFCRASHSARPSRTAPDKAQEVARERSASPAIVAGMTCIRH